MYPQIEIKLLKNHLFFNTTAHRGDDVANAFCLFKNAEIVDISIKVNHFIDIDVLHYDIEDFQKDIAALKEEKIMVLVNGKTRFLNVFELERVVQERENEIKTI